ncbi:hypothetical protein E6H20_10410 [Candidatus Bathyarchaeota archaeon]|nr:MAG: hypothetical protein E6H20_10410 [Candidatus Bathyarchaeota archaeon]
MSFIVLAFKSVWQYYAPTGDVFQLLDVFRQMVNDSIRTVLLNGACSLRMLSLLSYNQLARYDSPSCYKLCAISRAAGILAARKKSVRRGLPTKTPYAVRQQLVSCYGFEIRNGALRFPVSRGRRFSIPLTKHVLEIISQPGVKVRSFTLTRSKLSLCITRDTPMIEWASTVGVDRNLRNLTVGNDDQTRHYDLSKCVRIAKTTVRIVASFTRDDARIRTDRGRMNGWSFGEAQRQIEYKARWVGLPIIRLFRRETRGSSVSCPRCGERLQSDKRLERKLWCGKCRVVLDRDMVCSG